MKKRRTEAGSRRRDTRATPRPKPQAWRWPAVVACGLTLLAGSFLIFHARDKHVSVMAQARPAAPVSLSELLALPVGPLASIDLALMNLLCAQELPGASELNVSNLLATLDQWAVRVQRETQRHYYRYRNNPQEYGSSEAYFRMLMMAVVLHEDFNIRYNPDRVSSPATMNPNDGFFADSQDIFLQGLLGPRRLGTCSSMPVLYAAVGRRLGYPVKLVTTKAHLFIRWEDEKERFNLEATGRGMNRYDDEHFKRWPFPLTEAEIQSEGYLKSLNPPEEFAVFLALRADCLKEAGRVKEAESCYTEAARLSPQARSYRLLLAEMRYRKPPATSRVSTPPSVALPDPNPLSRIAPR